MTLFAPESRTRSVRSRKVFAMFELAYTAVDFLAALAFLAGSILFFWPEYETPAVWLFVAGSLLFALKPTLRLAREIRLAALGDDEDLADRLNI